jgi:hypothetical protein
MPKPSDHTPLVCLVIVAAATSLNAAWVVPSSAAKVKATQEAPSVMTFWECWFFPMLPWCTPPDPPSLPKPEVEPPSQPCGSDDSC